MRLRRFLAVLTARNKEFFRDRSALGWNIVLPVLIVMGFAFAFATDNLDLYKVGLHGTPDKGSRLGTFLDTEYIKFIEIEKLERAITKVERHQLDLLIDLEGRRYWVNDSSPRGYMLERVLAGTGVDVARQAVSGEEIRYVDWLIPGVLGMNMMFSALFGVGYVIVRYRKNGVLKRLKATPLTAFEFLAAQVVSRLWLIVALSALVYAGTNFFVGFRMHGSYLTLLLVWTLGAFSLISLGLVFAARLSNEEAANGLLNLISWPMMLMSGVWFSLEGSHPLVQKLALVFPLTHVIDAARAIMIDGAGVLEIAVPLLVLLAMSTFFLLIGAYSFRWE